MAKNGSLNKASIAKEDEFYTQLTDIEKELKHYKDFFRDKTVFCNCDDPAESNFWKYFELNFEHLGIKKLIATHFETDKPSYKLELIRDENGDGTINKLDIVRTTLDQNGDFRSPECIELLEESDVVITNPPFSLFREYVAQLLEYQKSFIIIGSQNAVTYKEIFPLLKNDIIWLGYNCGDMEFIVPSHYEPRETRYREENGIKYRSMGNICWYTNVDISKRHENLTLYRQYSDKNYPTYDNYNAINVNKIADIPCDFDGVMGVPITFFDKYNPKQFEIMGITAGRDEFEATPTKRYINPKQINADRSVTNGSKANTRATLILSQIPKGIYYTAENADGPLQIKYARILIRKKKEVD